MPVHDWTRVDAGTFHAFHTVWISEIMKALNAGLLPKGYYALAEQVATRMQTDVLTLHAPAPRKPLPRAPPRGGRHLVIRHITGHRVVALVEIGSPSNKDRKGHVGELAGKVVRILEA